MGGDMITLFKFAKENFSVRIMKTTLNCTFDKILNYQDFEIAITKFKEMKENGKDEIPEWIKHLYV